MLFAVLRIAGNNYAYIYQVTKNTKMVIDDILHYVGQVLLTEMQSGVAKTNICRVVLLDGLEVPFPLYVIALDGLKYKCVFQVRYVVIYCTAVNLDMR